MPEGEPAPAAGAGEIETNSPPRFEEGDRVRARTDVRDDGTFPGARRGDVLIRAGDVGYVRSVGVFLLRHYIYDVDFYEQGRIVGMRGHELAQEGDAEGDWEGAGEGAKEGEEEGGER